MKKSLLFAILIALTTLTSCRVTKTFTILNAKGASNNKEVDFLQNKAEGISYLTLSEDQKEQAVAIWKTEKESLGNAYEKKNKEIAPIIYKSEVNFRSILTEEQLKTYKEKSHKIIRSGYLNDKQLEELKRIYKL